MEVQIVNRKKQNKADRHGVRVDFKIDNPAKNTVIYQNVKVKLKTINGNGEKDTEKYEFTEAWKYNPNKLPTDSFLVPIDWRADQKGYMKVKTKIWAEEGKMDSRLKKGTSADYWGNLHGSFDLLEPKEPITIRKVKFKWDNIGRKAKSNFAGGKDLSF